MSGAETTAEVYWAAFRGLPKRERETIIEKLPLDRDFLEHVKELNRLPRKLTTWNSFESPTAEKSTGARDPLGLLPCHPRSFHFA